MGQTVSTVVSTVGSVAKTISNITDNVEKSITMNSPIFAYGIYFDDLYTLFLYDLYLSELEKFFQNTKEKIDKYKDEKEKNPINNDTLKTVLLLKNLDQNILFLKKIIIYSTNINKNSNNDNKMLMDYKDFLIRLYVIDKTIDKLYILHNDFLKEFIKPKFPQGGFSDVINEIRRMLKVLKKENEETIDKYLENIENKYKIIDNIFEKMDSTMDIDIESIIASESREEKNEFRSYFIHFDKLYKNLESKFPVTN